MFVQQLKNFVLNKAGSALQQAVTNKKLFRNEYFQKGVMKYPSHILCQNLYHRLLRVNLDTLDIHVRLYAKDHGTLIL